VSWLAYNGPERKESGWDDREPTSTPKRSRASRGYPFEK